MFENSNVENSNVENSNVENSNVENSNVENIQDNNQQGNTKTMSNLDVETIKKLIQSENDKIRGKYAKELKKKDEEIKKLREDIKELRSAYLTAEELSKIEAAETKKESEEYYKAYIAEKNKNFAKDTLSKYNLCSDVSAVLKLQNLVMGETEEEIEENVKNMTEYVRAIVDCNVKDTFKTNGRQVYKTNATSGGIKNPWSRDSFNLTEQMQIQINDPELANQLIEQAKN